MVLWNRLRPKCAAALLLLGVAAGASTTPSAQRLMGEALRASQHGQLDAAYLLAEKAAAQSPTLENRSVRDTLRQRATLAHLERAHGYALARQAGNAALEYRAALELEPENVDARQGLAGLYPSAQTPTSTDSEMRVQQAAPPVRIEPTPGAHDFEVRGTLRQAAAQIAAAFGLRAYVADAVPERSLHFTLTDATFSQAMAALDDLGGTGWIALDAHTLYLAQPEQLRDRTPLGVRTFYLPWVNDGLQLNEIANTAKSLLGLRDASVDAGQKALTVRAAPEQLDAAEQLFVDLRGTPGEVVLEVRILDLNATTARNLGMAVPDEFTMFALGPLLEQLAQNTSQAQEIFNLFEQGGLNAILNSGQLGAGALGGLQQQLSPLLQNPFVVFGGGATLMAISVPSATANLGAQSGQVTSVETALLRARSGQAAELNIGQKFPVINASFSPISLSPQIAQVLGNGSFVQPFPSFTYQDLGLDAKLTPRVTDRGGVRLQVDITETALSGVATNNIPILASRHVLTAISLRNNEPALLAGLFDQQEMKTLAGLPGLSQVPGFGKLFSAENRQTKRDQLVVMITPHVVQLPTGESAETWLPASFAPPGGSAATPLVFGTPRLVPPPLGGRGN